MHAIGMSSYRTEEANNVLSRISSSLIELLELRSDVPH